MFDNMTSISTSSSTTTQSKNHHHQQQQHHLLILTTTILSILIRSLIAYHPHSGQNNHHGSPTSYGGDYEAQRHWMEITINLPLCKWYTYDVQYWGLDYPPLIAYGSYVLGLLSYGMVGYDSIVLDESRGYENKFHKGFMRGTVIGLDLLFYVPIVYSIMKRLLLLNNNTTTATNNNNSDDYDYYHWILCSFGVLIQPALLIIDHGHFQYNAVCLGLALASFHYMTMNVYEINNINNHHNHSSIGWQCIIGSIFFCLSLNWKQMALYYAPAIFAYLLGRCFRGTTTTTSGSSSISSSSSYFVVLTRIAMLGITVISTFAVLWYPFYYYRCDDDQTFIEVVGVILRRIFPFSRGLFEGKVANIWCAASVKPISIRNRIPLSIQPLCAMTLTLAMVLPFCILLFNVGKNGSNNNIVSPLESSSKTNNKRKSIHELHLKSLLWGAVGSSLSFFLASFQVHEKSILLPLAPLSLLASSEPSLIHWFSIVSIWSMWHLLVVDRLQIPYFAIIIIYLCYVYMIETEVSDTVVSGDGSERISSLTKWDSWDKMIQKLASKVVIPISVFGMIALHILEAIITPPQTLPDLFPVLWTIGGCISFCFMWIMSLWKLFIIYSASVQMNESNVDKKHN